MNHNVLQIQVGNMANFSYILWDRSSNICAIIDPSWEIEKILNIVNSNSLKLEYIINTHSHFDHVLGNEQIVALTNAKIVQHSLSPLHKDIEVEDGSQISVGKIKLDVIYTPGHSEDSICLILKNHCIFSGDTIFIGNCGRTDLPGGNTTKLFYSLDRLKNLDDNLIIYPGHNYGQVPKSLLREEKKTNPFLQFNSLAEFLNFMG